MGTIYKLNFENGDFYIGQTANEVNTRIYHHLHTKGKGSPKLEKAFETSKYTGYEVLAELPTEELDAAEIKFISEMSPPLNTLPGGRTLRGLNHPRIRYEEWQIREVVRLFIETECKYTDITNITGVAIHSVHDILKGRCHAWATDTTDPKAMQDAENRRAKPDCYKVYDADNKEYIANSMKELAIVAGYTYSQITQVFKGAKSNLGLSLTPHDLIELRDPEGEAFVLTRPRAKEFLATFDELSRYCIEQLLDKQRPSKGWAAKILTS